MTRKQLADQIVYTLGLQDDTTFPESQYVLDLIYQGIQDIASKAKVYSRIINLTLTANTQTHDLSSRVIALEKIGDTDGNDYDRFTIEDAERAQRYGLRGYAWKEPMLWLSPIPDYAKELRAVGVFRPIKMTADADTPSHPDYGGLAEEFHPTVVTYCLWKAGEYMQHEASGNGEKWRVQYKGQDGHGGELAEIRTTINKRGTAGGPRRRNPLRSVGVVPDVGYWV